LRQKYFLDVLPLKYTYNCFFISMSTRLSLFTAVLSILILILIMMIMVMMIMIIITITTTTMIITTAKVKHNAEILTCTNQQQEPTALGVSLAILKVFSISQ